MARRLPPQADEWIDRSQPLDFRFENERVAAYEGDVITSAGDEHLFENNLLIDYGAIAGRVSSVAYSPHRQAMMGLAIAPLHLGTEGTSLNLRCSSGQLINAKVVKLPFYDPDNQRQHEQV